MIAGNLRAAAWKYAAIASAVLGVAACIGCAFLAWRADALANRLSVTEARAVSAEAYARDLSANIETERKASEGMAAIATQEIEMRREIEQESEARVADLRAGTVRLRHEIGALYTAQLSQAAAAGAQPSGAAERGAELVAAAVGVGAQCDARQRALVEAYEAMRRPAP